MELAGTFWQEIAKTSEERGEKRQRGKLRNPCTLLRSKVN